MHLCNKCCVWSTFYQSGFLSLQSEHYLREYLQNHILLQCVTAIVTRCSQKTVNTWARNYTRRWQSYFWWFCCHCFLVRLFFFSHDFSAGTSVLNLSHDREKPPFVQRRAVCLPFSLHIDLKNRSWCFVWNLQISFSKHSTFQRYLQPLKLQQNVL